MPCIPGENFESKYSGQEVEDILDDSTVKVADIASNRTDIDSAATRIAVTEINVAAIDTKVAILETDVSDITTKVATIEIDTAIDTALEVLAALVKKLDVR